MSDPTGTPPADGLDELSFEQARDGLVEVVAKLESGGVSLDESVALWERGERLAAICQQRLDGVRARLDAAVAAGTGTTDSQP